VWAYDASTGVASNTGLVRNAQYSLLSRDGSRALLRGTPSGNSPTETLIDASNAVLGQLPDAASHLYVLSPDGMLAAQMPNLAEPVGQIRLFDLDAPNGSGFYEARPDPLVLTDTDDTYVQPIGVAPDGGALFILGDKNFWTELLPGS
jgi:hypothetical protein